MAQVRVYSLAKALDVESRRVMAYLTQIGEFVRSASSPLPPPVVARVRAHFTGRALAALGSPPAVAPVPRPPSDDYRDDVAPDPEDLLEAGRAAREFGVATATIRKWVARGYLTRSGSRGQRALYRRRDLLDAQRATGARTRRTPSPAPMDIRLMRGPITTAQAAQLAQVSASTIRMWVLRGHLHPTRVGRPQQFDPFDILRVARRSTRPLGGSH